MQYTTFLTHELNQQWRAVVPGLPNCVVEAPTRADVIQKIQNRINEIVRQTEVLRIDGPTVQLNSNPAQNSLPPWEWFGAFQDDPTWPQLFDQIEEERNAVIIEA